MAENSSLLLLPLLCLAAGTVTSESSAVMRQRLGSAGKNIPVYSPVIVNYLVECLAKVSVKVPSVAVAPFVPGGQRLVPGAEELGIGQYNGCFPLARHCDLGVFHDTLKQGHATAGWLRRCRD